MIILGSKGKARTTGSGTFYCPVCRARCSYLLKEYGRYFTMYFIPLFRTKKIGTVVECQTCGITFKEEVLEYSQHIKDQQHAVKELISDIQRRLEAGAPINLLLSSLVEAGVDENDASVALMIASERKIKTCTTCRHVYKSTLNYCPYCGKRLKNSEDS